MASPSAKSRAGRAGRVAFEEVDDVDGGVCRLLDRHQVGAIGQNHHLGAWNAAADVVAHRERRDVVVGADHHQRRRGDGRDALAQVHVGDRLAAAGITAAVGFEEKVADARHRRRVAFLETGGEPARHDRIDDCFGAGVDHGGGALPPEIRRRQMGRRCHQHQACRPRGMEDGESLCRHAAQREPDDMRLGNVERVEEAGEIVGEIVDGGGLVARAGAAVALRVVAQHAETAAERRGDLVPHLDGAAQRIGEGDGRQVLRAGQIVEQVDAVDGDGRHGQSFLKMRLTACAWRTARPAADAAAAVAGLRSNALSSNAAGAPSSASTLRSGAPVSRTRAAAFLTRAWAPLRPILPASAVGRDVGEDQAVGHVEIGAHALRIDMQACRQTAGFAKRAGGEAEECGQGMPFGLPQAGRGAAGRNWRR